ncbi:MAG: T9SS type A sorting domain-containing protein [Candidatus Coatesbacteria bacterium]|nr:T9SS type A sorting domain-containing protein [Candidatus Coatesbacteria bacterium]
MKSITILILLGLISSLFSAPGDFLGTVHEFDKNQYMRGLGLSLEDSVAFVNDRSERYIYVYDCFYWQGEKSYLFGQDGTIRSLDVYIPLKDLALSGGDTEKIYICDYSSENLNIKKAFTPPLHPANIAYIQTLAEDSVYLRVGEYRGKTIMRFSLPNYDFKDSQVSDIINNYEYSSFCGLTYDIKTNYLIAVVYQHDGSNFKGLDLFALDPVTLARIHHVPLMWAGSYIYDLRYVPDYPVYGRCYLATYYDVTKSCSTIIAIEAFEGEGFKENNSSSSLPSPSFSISPNPFSNRLSLSLPLSGAIYSLTGQLIMKLDKGKHSIDTSKWKQGVYIVKSGKETKRIVKIN